MSYQPAGPESGLPRWVVFTEDGDCDGFVWAESESNARRDAEWNGTEGDFYVVLDEGDDPATEDEVTS